MKVKRGNICYNSGMKPGLIFTLTTAFLCVCGCAGATPGPAVEYVAKYLWFDEVRPVSARLKTVKLPKPANNTPWWAYLPGIPYGTWREDAAENAEVAFDPTLCQTPNGTRLSDPDYFAEAGRNRSVLSELLTNSLAFCLGRAGIFEVVEILDADRPVDAELQVEFTQFRKNTRLYTYGVTPLISTATFWLVGCPLRGIRYEFEVKCKLVGTNGKEIWKGKASGRSSIVTGSYWSGHSPERTAFYEAYTLLLTDLFKKLAKNLPPPDDETWLNTTEADQ